MASPAPPPAPPVRSTAHSVLDLIGQTPLVRLSRVSPEGGATVWGKAELLNPGGSVKDRPALAMILAAEQDGKLGPGSTIVEATSGNTGISLALIAAVRGYRCIVVMPDDMSQERRQVMQAYGAEIALTAAADGMAGAVSRARELLRTTPNAFMPSQFTNPANPQSHEHSTALEIVQQLPAKLDAFVAGVGTGGTVSGVGRYLKQHVPGARVIAVEPKNSAVLSGGRPGPHALAGLGAGFIPATYDSKVIDRIITVTDPAAERMARLLARREGLLVGPSAGANVHAACLVAAELGPDAHVVTVLCDTGQRYLS